MKSLIHTATGITWDEVTDHLSNVPLNCEKYSDALESSVLAFTDLLEPDLNRIKANYLADPTNPENWAEGVNPDSIAPTVSLVIEPQEEYVQHERSDTAESTMRLKFTSGDMQRSCTIPLPRK